MAKTPTWQRAEGKNPKGGLNEKGRASLRAEGHDIKRPQPEGGSRRDSFCARMKGMKKKLTSAETANDPDSRINKSLRAWNCADGGAVDPYAAVQEAAKGGAIWDKPRPKKLGKPDPLSSKEKASAKAAAKAAGRPYPNLIDNMRAARADGGEADPYEAVQQAANSDSGMGRFSDEDINRAAHGATPAVPPLTVMENAAPVAPVSDAMRSAYNAAVPPTARLLAESAMGVHTPITERDFSPSDIQNMKDRLAEQQQFNASRERNLQSIQDTMTPEGYRHYQAMTDQPIGGSEDYRLFMAQNAEKLKSFQDTRGQTAVPYGNTFGRDDQSNQPLSVYTPEQGNFLTSMQRSYTDPGYRTGMTLGRFNVYDTPQGRVAVDNYDFRGRKQTPSEMLHEFQTQPTVTAIRGAIPTVFPNIERPVAINLDRPGNYTYTGKPIVTPGSHLDPEQTATPSRDIREDYQTKTPGLHQFSQSAAESRTPNITTVLPPRRPTSFADGGPVDDRAHEFVQEQLQSGEPQVPQYVAENDFPARAARGVEAVDTAASRVNNMLANVVGQPAMRSPEGRSASEIVQSAMPVDPYQAVQQAARQWHEGDRLGAAETMATGMPMQGAIRAYHGSPYKFEQFDPKFIGTGEGAQAYGHGLYFAGNPKVAESYRNDLSKGTLVRPTGEVFSPMNELEHLNVRVATDRFGVDAGIKRAEQLLAQGAQDRPYRTQQALVDDYNRLLELRNNAVPNPGHMYEVDIHAKPEHLLDWDRPLSQQSESVRSAIQPRIERLKSAGAKFSEDPTGDVLWRAAHPQGGIDVTDFNIGPAAQASQILSKAGIPGIRYLDQGSRVNTPRKLWNDRWQVDTGPDSPMFDTESEARKFYEGLLAKSPQTSNYVVFDPRNIEILRRYADGGEVIGDKVEGDVQFLEDDPYAKVQEAAKLPMMAQNDFAMRMPQPEVRYDTGPQPGEATLKGYEPTIREQIAQKMMGDQAPSPERRQFVEGLMGTSGIGERGMGVADFVPVAGQALQAQESYQNRDPKGFLLATVPVPGANIEGKIAQGAAAAVERAMAGQAAQQMTKSQSQAAMKQAWEAGQGNTDKFRNWQHQWNVEQGPQYAVQQAVQAAPPAMGHNMPPEPMVPDYNRIVNPAGFYSLGHEVASTQLPSTVRTWQEMQSLLKKGGVKDEEMQFAGLLGMDPATKISRDEIAQAFERNFPQVETIWKRSSDPVPAERINQAIENRTQAQNDLRAANTNLWNAANPTHQEDPVLNIRGDETPWSLPDLRTALMNDRVRFDDLDENIRGPAMDWQDAWRRYQNAESQVRNIEAPTRPEMAPKWEKYTHPGGTDYSESVLRLPYNNPASFRHIAPEIEAKYSDQHAALKEKLFNLKESYEAQKLHDIQQFNTAMESFKQRYYDRVLNDALAEGMAPEAAMRHAQKFSDNSTYNAMSNYLGEPVPREMHYSSPRSEQLNEEIYKTRNEIGAFTQKMLDESRALAGYPSYTEQVYRHETHLGDIDNPLLHQRWKERVGPEGERILSNEEFQSDLGQEGAERGFKDPTADKRRVELERQRDALQKEWDNEQRKLLEETNAKSAAVMRQKRDEIAQATTEYNKTNQLRSAFDAYNEQLAAIDDKYAPLLQPFKDQHNAATQQLIAKYKPESKRLNDAIAAIKPPGEIPLFPHVGSTDQWVELGAKHALQHALESGHDKIFIMGGQEQARRWQSGLRQAVDNISWESPAAEAEIPLDKLRRDYAKRIYGREAEWELLPLASREAIERTITKSTPQTARNDIFRTVYTQSNTRGRSKFDVDKDGFIIDSDVAEARPTIGRDQRERKMKLSAVVGGDIAKKVMSGDAGNIPMKDYIMGAEGYTQHYERKVPSIYKDIIKKYLKVNPKVESGSLMERGVESNEIPPWGQLERLGYGKWKINFPDGSYRDDLSREHANRLIERGKQNFEAMGRTWEPKNVPPIEGPHGTYIHITPEMREAYRRIKEQRGSVFPGYAQGGEVVNKPDPYDNVRKAAKISPRARRASH